VPKPNFLYRQIDGRHHCFCLTCLRTVGESVDKLALRGLERAHACKSRDVQTIQRVKAEATAKKTVRQHD